MNAALQERLEMCEKVGAVEGTERGDAISLLVRAARVLSGISADHELHITLLVAEKLSRETCEWYRDVGYDDDPEGYEEFPADVYSHFLGGAEKKWRGWT